jgi:hypothetical protein
VVSGRQDLRTIDSRTYTYVGADGRASTTPVGSDDAAARFWASELSERPHGYGFPQIQWVGTSTLLDHYRANPTHLAVDGIAGPVRQHASYSMVGCAGRRRGQGSVQQIALGLFP